MVRSQTAVPTLSLDGKRIAANSVVIALHVAALMMLLAPVQTPMSTTMDEPEMQVVQVDEVKPIQPPPPTPTSDPKPHPQPPSHASTPIAQIAPPSEITYTDGTEQAIPDTGQQVDVDTDVGPSEPALAALTTDRAPAPPYPPMALRRGITGTVVLLVLVGADGAPLDVSVEQSSGSKLLDEAAQKFVRSHWHFNPALQGSIAISAYARVPINFTLGR
ncbi:MAG TPA: TonB family protein [Arenimonas sp.]|uniref:energy transducer TonB n=1 Tax=Arenimonas sp. TaxID=1872635 RepID=UPI002CFFF471|nr:TonB family protein [Arenimonas sp.]HMB58059.1 TonB family protein [Arenimonas sp.]